MGQKRFHTCITTRQDTRTRSSTRTQPSRAILHTALSPRWRPTWGLRNQCPLSLVYNNIEYKCTNSWHHSVFTLNTKVKTQGITVYSHRIQIYKLMASQCIHFEYNVSTWNAEVKTHSITVENRKRNGLEKLEIFTFSPEQSYFSI
ncbi:hypothetical protein OUZ56_014259 [Daphnia magna]|uniref:Uncharacterized protein n=1 Tax=Daphnia magna TaxID=35525 RepID=A0ABR0AJ84_9CRUS|nr:hypothetical protein OUZ56_014259 [Daphnia magna]